jgi:hypothetical protein
MYLIILISFIAGFGFLNIRFPFNYDIYVNYLIEKLEYLRPKYVYLKDKISPILIKLGYNLLYGFSVCQIQVNKMKKMLVPHIENVKKYLKDNNIIVEVTTQIVKIVDKNGDIEHMLVRTDKIPLEQLSYMFDENRHIGLFVYDKNFETGCTNKIYYEKFPDIIDYKVSNVNFMMIELEHNNEKYTIELKNNEYNYYIVNNSLNQKFFKYYLKNIIKAPIDDIFNYTVTIIDYNINIITLLPEQYIIFNENDYTIFPISETDNSTNYVDISDTINTNNNDEKDSIDSDKSEGFVKLEVDN